MHDQISLEASTAFSMVEGTRPGDGESLVLLIE